MIWFYVVLGIFWWPLYGGARILLQELWERWEAHSLGARRLPRFRGNLPGNVDLLLQLMQEMKKGYPGMYYLTHSLSSGSQKLVDQLGPTFNANILFENLITTTHPEHLQIILATDFPNYVKGEGLKKRLSPLFGVGVFNSDGDLWKFHRQLTRPFFTRDRISHFDIFDRHAATAIHLMKQRLREGYPFDFQDIITKFTLDSATEFLFGVNVHSLSASLPYPPNISRQTAVGTDLNATQKAQTFAQALLDLQNVVSFRVRVGPLWPLWELLEDKSIAPMKVVNAFVEPIVSEAVGRKKANRTRNKKSNEIDEDETLLDHLVNLTDDPVILKDETLNILLAGRDTTSSTLAFILYFLCMYPDVTIRLREEILEKVGSNRRPTYEDIREMKYLRAVINAEEFDPDRFLDARLKKYLSPRPFIFLPFNAGPRICLGQQFAYNEMSFILIKLLQTFKSFTLEQNVADPEFHPPAEWKNAPGRKGLDNIFPKLALTMLIGGGLWIKAEEVEA
ncbi:hypothetical protein VNI00_007129 [Paramarasmius palmivorus]|uniref:Cytochrome P450 n=1 Tax=Paramarasmius palmivorus TaxID=297713 RepID=A0AAW0D3B7_9AGAR